MRGYFATEGSKFKGRPLTALPDVLNRDLSRIINSNLLKRCHDLEHLRSIAQQRDEWTKLTARIREAAEASHSRRDNHNAVLLSDSRSSGTRGSSLRSPTP
ncbi:hypothetical protein ElyMa_006908900 [Elysia marginata]|uniref:Uncharacterized protein n=1 Tax=Elysia marginata TaxID=1093978 RepID=A0AAV4JFP8_9GAST|nr:hypothetical protein ElyMa_006908900 [Elysia marginata]